MQPPRILIRSGRGYGILTELVGSKYERNLPCPILDRKYTAAEIAYRSRANQRSSTEDDSVGGHWQEKYWRMGRVHVYSQLCECRWCNPALEPPQSRA
jgi:hypothetical protein